jgi:hypothetical protein
MYWIGGVNELAYSKNFRVFIQFAQVREEMPEQKEE